MKNIDILKEKDRIKFNNYILKSSGCWLWIGGKHIKGGYGKFSIKIDGKSVTFVASRLAYYFEFGDFDDKLLVCHKCDNPQCVNPEHLFLGTVKDNALDCKMKNRLNSSRGEKLSSLTNNDVINIRKLYEQGVSQREISRIYNIGYNAVWYIVHNITWKHIK